MSPTPIGPRALDTVATHFDKGEQYEALLDEAEAGIVVDADAAFVQDMRDRWEQYGMRAYLSERQLAWLNRLADSTP